MVRQDTAPSSLLHRKDGLLDRSKHLSHPGPRSNYGPGFVKRKCLRLYSAHSARMIIGGTGERQDSTL